MQHYIRGLHPGVCTPGVRGILSESIWSILARYTSFLDLKWSANWQLTFMLALDDFDILYVLESSSDSKTISFSFDDFVYLVYNIKLWQWCSVFAYNNVFSTWGYTWCLCIIHGYSDESRLRTPANVCIADEKSQ